MMLALVRLNLIGNIQETGLQETFLSVEGISIPFQKLPGQSLGIPLGKLKKQREGKEGSFAFSFHLDFGLHRGHSDPPPVWGLCVIPHEVYFPSPVPGTHLVLYKCLLKGCALRYLENPSRTVSPSIHFGLTLIIVGAVSSPGEVTCSRAAHWPLDCLQKRISDGCADALVKWNEVVSIFTLLESAAGVGSRVVVRAGGQPCPFRAL